MDAEDHTKRNRVACVIHCDFPRKWSIPKKIDGATRATRKGPMKRCPAAERLSHLPCPLHQVRPSASAMALCTSPEHRFRPSASVKLQQAVRSSLHALERRTWSRSHRDQRHSLAPCVLGGERGIGTEERRDAATLLYKIGQSRTAFFQPSPDSPCRHCSSRDPHIRGSWQPP